jgi:magnesium transporter
MVRNYRLDCGKLGQPCEAGDFICYSSPSPEERAQLSALGITDHDVSCALDPDELGRVEAVEDHVVFIVKTPRNYSDSDNYLFRVTSFGLFLFPDKLIMLCPFDERETLDQRPLSKIRSRNELLLRLFSATVAHFFGHLKVINLISDSLEQKVNTSMENRHLLSMFSIGKSLIYILNGINSNSAVLERLKNSAGKLGFSDEERELLDDIVIENAQCNRQAEIYADILTSLTDARGNIVNNNLNILIKRLTIVSVVFMPLNVLAGIGGMSEFSAMTNGIPYPVSYGILAFGFACVAGATWFIIKKMSPEEKQRKPRRHGASKRRNP